MSENSRKVFEYLKSVKGKDVTSADVAEALGMEKRSVDGTFTALQRKGLGVRIPAELELADGSHRAIKILQLTEAADSFDPDAE